MSTARRYTYLFGTLAIAVVIAIIQWQPTDDDKGSSEARDFGSNHQGLAEVESTRVPLSSSAERKEQRAIGLADEESGAKSPVTVAPLPATGKDLEALLKTMLVRDQMAALGRAIDGSIYIQRRAMFCRALTQMVEEDPIYNPRRMKLDAAGKEKLSKLLDHWNEILSERDASIHKSEMELVRSKRCHAYSSESGQFDAGVRIAFQQNFDYCLLRLRHVTGGGLAGIYAFGWGMSGERDSLMLEQSNLLALGEQDLVDFFRSSG